jgi:hypothetical protein
MNLQPVKQNEGYSTDVVADLDGEPFVDYYCPDCRKRVQP